MDAEGVAIELVPTHAGYTVKVEGQRIGSLLLRIYDGHQRVEDCTVLAVPAATDVKTWSFATIGAALDYLLFSCVVEESDTR